jgi:hypothetical protein
MDVTEYESWALQENFPAFTAAALWCGKNPYYCGSWDDALFNQIGIITISLIKHQFIAEDYPKYKLDVVLSEINKKFAQGKPEFLEMIGKFILSREQLKAIAEKSGVKPEFLFSGDSSLDNSPPVKEELESKQDNESCSGSSSNLAKGVENEPKKPISKSIKVTPVFSKFEDLRPNEIAFVMMDDKTAKMVIRGEKINICPQDLGLKTGSRGWKLLEGASMVSGDLTQVLRSINKTSDRAKEKNRIKKAVADLNKSIKNSMGLSANPINYVIKSGYNFIFRSMTHEKLHGKNISKGNDAMDHIDYNGLSKREYSNFDEGDEAEAYHDNDEPDEDESVDSAGFWHDANE